MNTQEFFNKYDERCARESALQGIDQLIFELSELGIQAESAQTGGFIMCAYIELQDGQYIYANPYGAGIYDEDGYELDIIQLEEGDNRTVAEAIANYIKEKK